MATDCIEWRPVVGYEGVYSVSNTGLVRRDLGSNGAVAGKILKSNPQTFGYFGVCLCMDGIEKFHLVHRLVAAAFFGPCTPEKKEVNHKDLDRSNNHVSNLEYVSRLENAAHAWMHGRYHARWFTTPEAKQFYKSVIAGKAVRS